MWFGILTPGAHPSRPVPTVDDATVFCWTPRERVRIDGPAFALHGGLRTLRRSHQETAAGLLPRCFACREPCRVPDADALRADEDVPTYAGRPGDPGVPRDEYEAIAALADAMDRGASAPRRAVLAFAHLEDLAGAEDPPLDEEALVVVRTVGWRSSSRSSRCRNCSRSLPASRRRVRPVRSASAAGGCSPAASTRARRP
jgi:hypothetical protein